jgi:hypothetical protein
LLSSRSLEVLMLYEQSLTVRPLAHFAGAYVGPSIPLAATNVATNGGGSPLRPRTSPPPPPPPTTQESSQESQQSNHHQVSFIEVTIVVYYNL